MLKVYLVCENGHSCKELSYGFDAYISFDKAKQAILDYYIKNKIPHNSLDWVFEEDGSYSMDYFVIQSLSLT